MHKIKKIISSWFLSKPLLYSVITTHELVPKDGLSVPMRTGRLRIEYSPEFLEKCDDSVLEKYLEVEVYRILLGHPYKRQPYKAEKKILLLASDITIYQYLKKETSGIVLAGVEYLKNEAVRFGMLTHPLGEKWIGSDELKFFQKNLVIDHKTGELILSDKLSFEEWYNKIHFLIKETSTGGENAGSGEGAFINSEASDLWEENEEALSLVKDEIQKVQVSDSWGENGGDLERAVKEDADFSFDYRHALTKFRSSIISNSRRLTRMKPSRRYGFNAMGSRYERKADILIAVDVSGSITDESFNHFCHAIKNFFFLGIIEKIDLIFFDVNLKNTTPLEFRKNVDLNKIKGKGGTNFQPPLDYFFEHKDKYNGMIIFTDGEGDIPRIKTPGTKKSILWILDSFTAYNKCRQWITKELGCEVTYLPF